MTSTLSAVPDHPSERADRWLPTRAGLTSVWRYVEETFEFHRGRLLLRGPNGSGKSMALELLLPFLLDADTSPSRLTSAAKSRGGLFDRIMTGADEPSRTGYAWAEFRRGRDSFTIGARLRASQSTRKVDVDYFTTTQVVGEDLHLLDERRVPLALKTLKEAVGERGRVHGTADEYRNAVRETLYEGFGPDRYASVVTALLALRKEKLSQNLDLDKLSDVMSEALPPIDEHDIAAVAEGFERLDRRRDQLESLRLDLRQVDALVNRQRGYARHVVAWLAETVRAAESRRDTVTRTAREAAETLATEQERLRELVERDESLDRSIRETRAQVGAYREREEYREGSRLVELQAQLRDRRRDLEEGKERLGRAEERLARVEADLDGAVADLDAAEGNLAHARQALADSALAADSGAVVEEATALVDPSTDGEDARRLVEAHVTARRQAISMVRTVLREHERAAQQRDIQAEAVEHALAALDQAVDAARAARERLEAASAEHVAALEQWVGSCRQIPHARLRAAMPDDVADPARVEAALARLRTDLHVEHDRSVGEVVRQQRQLDEMHAGLAAEHERHAAGSLVEPDPPAWRDDRTGQPGAPLWRTVDVAREVPAEVLDGVEAALSAAGLLDAWVRADGSVDLGRSDLTLAPAPLDGDTLRSVLAPLDQSDLAAELVDGVLRSIRVVDTVGRGADRAIAPAHAGSPGAAAQGVAAEVAIGRDGTFRLGAAVGRGAVGPAALLGAEARERRRLARLAELDGLIEVNRQEHRRLGAELEAMARAWQATVAELDTAPTGEGVRAAEHDRDTAQVREDERRRQWQAQRKRLGDAEQRVRDAVRRLTAEAARHRVPSDVAALDELARAIDALERAVAAWTGRWRERRGSLVRVTREREGLDAATAVYSTDRDAHARVERAVEDLATRVRAVEEALGSSYHDILRRIDELDRQREADEQERIDLASARPKVERLIGGLETSLQQAETDRVAAEDHRSAVHRHFASAVGRGLVHDAGVAVQAELEGVTAVLSAAREVAASLGQIDTGQPARDRASIRVEEQLHLTRQRLTGYDLERTPTDDGWIELTALSGGQRRRVGHLAGALRANLDSATAELHDEEEQLFARVLAGDIRRALAARIRHANALVASINHQLEHVKTQAGGVQARLAWKVDDEQPDAVRSARALLLRDPSDLDDGETAALQSFVRARVEQARAELEANAPWEARLRETLDYRRWHRFTLQIAHRDWDGYQPATARRLQKLSTGERSIALHLPMLASIAAHYTAADGGPAACPRLILLDELFAGVDPANRAQLFARFTAWDLDAVFTSDHEWCQYATLDGIAIHHLHPPVGDEPVTSTRFTWDGRQRTIDPPAA